jgi:hypothetical protein
MGALVGTMIINNILAAVTTTATCGIGTLVGGQVFAGACAV